MTDSTGLEYNSSRFCYRCRVNGSVRKWKFIFRYSYSAFLCAPCVQELGGSALAREWLEQNARFSKTGALLFPDQNKVKP